MAKKGKARDWKDHKFCRDCKEMTPVTDKHLDWEGRPILGRCPHITDRMVIISHDWCVMEK